MNGFPVLRGGLALCALLIVSGAPVSSGPMYTIIDLGTLGGLTSVALGINNLGQVVGSADNAQGKRHAFLWQNGTMTDLGLLPGNQYAEAWDINNNGVVCGGVSGSGNAWSPFVWENGVMTQLSHINGTPTGDSTALALNDAGQVVGVSNGVSVIWQNDTVMSFFSTYGVSGTPWDINSAPQVSLGRSLLDLNTGDAEDLGTLGGNITQAFGVSSAGQVTGQSEREPGTADFHAFIWQSGNMTDLSLLGGFDYSRAEAINGSGQVVGWSEQFGSEPVEYGFLYIPGNGVHNLETMIPPGTGWSLLSPRDINDGGQIVGAGTINGFRHAFLLTPAPVPAVSAGGVIVLGLVMLVMGILLLRGGATSQG